MKVSFNKKLCIIFSIISSLLCIGVICLHKLYYVDNTFHFIYFAISILFCIAICAVQSIDFTLTPENNKKFMIITSIISIVFICFTVELLNTNNMFTIGINKLLFNFLIIALLYLIIFAITNRLRLTLITSNIILFILGFAIYMVSMFRGTPLSLLDILSLQTGISVAFTYKMSFDFYFVLAFISLILITSIISKVNYKYDKKYKLFRILSLLGCTLLIFVFYTTNFISIFNLYTYLWIPENEYKTNGFLASFIKQVKDIRIVEPEDYSLKLIADITKTDYLSEMQNSTTIPTVQSDADKPNIIVIMNESFSEMAVHRNFATSEDYIPYLRTILASTISGYVHSSVYGGRTPNSEWEFLTNNSMAFFSYANVPYQQFIRSNSYSLVSTLKALGYTATSIHPWYSTGYRRNYVYQLFGFDSSEFVEDMDDLEYIRTYPSDLSTYKHLIKRYEEKDDSKPFFNFTITMQNHSGYDIPGMDSEIFLTEIENCPRVEQYLTLLKKSDEALQYLINYFSNEDEKTIILFFGDHQPPYIEDEFWNYINEGKDDNSLADAEKGYLTPYFIWANYDLPDYDIPDISLNYLSILLLDVAGLKTTPYMNYLRHMQKQIPVITGHGYMTSDGTYHNFDENTEVSKLIDTYKNLQFNNMFDKKNRLDELFSLEKAQ